MVSVFGAAMAAPDPKSAQLLYERNHLDQAVYILLVTFAVV